MFRRSNPFTQSMLAVLAGLMMSTTAIPAAAVVTETLKLVPDDPQIGSFFGSEVAIGNNVAVVGAGGAGLGGAAYIFDTGTGNQLAKIVPDDLPVGGSFGRSVAVQGNLAIIGATAGSKTGTGSAYVYDLTTYDLVAKLVSDDFAGGWFGSSVAIHGNTALVGAFATEESGFEGVGSAYLFDITTGNQIAKLVSDTPQITGFFGTSVAMDASHAAVYAGGSNQVYLFDSLTGLPIADFLGPGISAAGDSLALNGDQLLLGTANINSGDDGVRLFDIGDVSNITSTNVPWPGPGFGQFFGKSVALQDNVMLVSTWFSEEIVASGIVHMFDPDTGNLLESFRSSDGVVDDAFGQSIGLHGQTLIVGAPGEPTTTGAAYLFTIPEPATLAVFLVAGPALLGRAQASLCRDTGRSPGGAGG